MKLHLLIFTSFLLLAACGNSGTPTSEVKDSSTAHTTRMSEKIIAIADAIPLVHDSATSFFTALFVPGDSLRVTTDGDYKHFTGKDFTLVINNTSQDSVKDVTVWPSPGGVLQVPLKELSIKMDSSWKELPNGPIAVKEPPPAVIAYYTDQQHRKKKFVVLGPSGFNTTEEPVIREINISVDEQ